MNAHEKLAEFYGRTIEEVQALSRDILTAMEVLVTHEDFAGLHHLGYVFYERKE